MKQNFALKIMFSYVKKI